MATLESIATETDQRAEELEDDMRRLALVLFAFELAFIMQALTRARSEAEVVAALRAATVQYRSPSGLFRQRWEDEFTELMTDQAFREARRALPAIGRRTPHVALPPSAEQVIRAHAVELADIVTATSALKLEAATLAVTREISDRRADIQPPSASPAGTPAAIDQRLESLVPLVGRQAATEIMETVRAGAAKSTAKLATDLVEQVHATEIMAVRAQRIARTESIGLINMTEHERAVVTGVLREKKWLSQRDGRVRVTHQECDKQGWIPITDRFAANGLAYPGERPAPASELVNCRCSIAFRA